MGIRPGIFIIHCIHCTHMVLGVIWESDLVSSLYTAYTVHTWYCSYYRVDILHCQRLKNSSPFKVHSLYANLST